MVGARKRKRAKEKEILKGVKVRRSSSTNAQPNQASPASVELSPDTRPPADSSSPTDKKNSRSETGAVENVDSQKATQPLSSDAAKTSIQKSNPTKAGLVGLVDYGSDEDSP